MTETFDQDQITGCWKSEQLYLFQRSGREDYIFIKNEYAYILKDVRKNTYFVNMRFGSIAELSRSFKIGSGVYICFINE